MTRKPDFIYIGAARSGSTYLYKMLKSHPELFIPVAKEINFFSKDENFKKGINWYFEFFKSDRKIVGEIDHDYFLQLETATRIKAIIPNVKIICSLREPIAKTYSQFLFWRGTKIDKRLSFNEYALLPETIAAADYYTLLKSYFSLFPPNQILVLFFDELATNPNAYLNRVLKFLNLDHSVDAKLVQEIVNPQREPRNRWFLNFAYKIYLGLKKIDLINFSGNLKYNSLINKLLFKTNPHYPLLSVNEIELLKPYYHNNLDNLEKLIQTPLPQAWRSDSIN